MKIFKEFLLCFSVALITFIEFIFIGNFYDANENSLLTNIVLWTTADIIAYVLFIFIPFFNKKKVNYLDGFAFASGFFGITIYCLSQAKSFDEYTYLSAISYLSGFISIIEVILIAQRKTRQLVFVKKVDKHYLDMLHNLSYSSQASIVTLLKNFEYDQRFKLSDAAILLSISENKTQKILKEAIECGIISEEGKTQAKRYYINK